MRFLLRFSGRRSLALIFLASTAALVLDVLSIALLFPFLRLFTAPELVQTEPRVQALHRALGFVSPERFIAAVGVALALFFVLRFFAKISLNKVRYDCTNRITFRLATELFTGLLGARYSLFTKESTSEMIGIINAHTIHSLICLDAWITIANEASFLVIVLGVFFVLNPALTLAVVALFGAIGLALYGGLVKKIDAYGQIHSRLNLLVYKFAFAVAHSIKDIKIMGLEGKYAAKFTKIWEDYSRNDGRAKTAKAVPRDFAETLVFGGLIAVCLYVLATGRDLVGIIPMLGVVAVSSLKTLPSFNRIMSSYNEYKYYRNSLVVVEELAAKLAANRQVVLHSGLPFGSSIGMRDVGFCYDDKQVLDAVSLTIAKGSSVAFVGASGAGKSTLLDILAGLQQAGHGEFTLDGNRFDPFATDTLRSRIGYVPQNVNLIDESVAYNISFEEHPDGAQLERVIRMARLAPYVAQLPRGVDTVIGESGVRVSGGQRQRIGIARALYRDPEVLVFDEATSSLDAVTERELMAEINALSGTKTVIIVAHRLSTVVACDAIHLLEEGRIVARGTHHELLLSCPQYQKLYQQQQA